MLPDAYWIERAGRAASSQLPRAGRFDAIELLPPHASMRRYARVRFEKRVEVVMLLPEPGGGPEEVGASVVSRASDEPFVAAQRWLTESGVRVPALFAVDDDAGCIWLEDVGATDLDTWLAAQPDLARGYERPIATLLGFQTAVGDAAKAPHFVASKTFGSELMRWELDHYREWRLEAELGVSLTAAQRARLDAEFDRLVDLLVAVPIGVMHRDFQSHNLMVLGDELVVLDFQDAMLGPVVYDAVALLRDSYVTIPPGALTQLVTRYATAASALPCFAGAEPEQIQNWFFLQTVQRKLKDAGRFVFIDRVKKNPGFLRHIPSSLTYVVDALGRLPQLRGLREVLAEVDPGLPA